MDDLGFNVSLLTPGSDLVTASRSAILQGIFARAGNDTIYSFDPGTDNNKPLKVDFLFGDFFDNSPQEIQIILDILGGNFLAILDRGRPPSVGQDRFVLGDRLQPYYTNFNPFALATTDFLGLNQFAIIYDFDPANDTIQLNGNPQDYVLIDIGELEIPGVEQAFSGKAIFSLQQGLPDLVSYIVAPPELELSLNDQSFRFVGEKPFQEPFTFLNPFAFIQKLGQLRANRIDLGLDAVTDSSDNVYFTGYTSGSLAGPNQGLLDVWVARYNSNGNQTLFEQIGSPSSDIAYAIATDEDSNFYLAGDTGGSFVETKQSESAGEGWVAKYDNSGNRLWGRQIGVNQTGGFANPIFGLDLDPAGNVYASGLAVKDNERTDIFNFNVEDDPFLVKYDSNGNQQWFRQIDTAFFAENYDLTVDKDGNSYLTGWTQGLIEIGPDGQPREIPGGREADPSRQLLKYDAWLAKYDTNGNREWVRQFGSVNEGVDFAWAVNTDSQGNVYATGWTTQELGTTDEASLAENYNIWLTKFDPDGNQLWAIEIGSEGDDGMFISDMEIDAEDNIFLTGYTNDSLGEGPVDERYNTWVAKFDTDGNNEWIQQFGSEDNLDYGTGLAADGKGQLYVTGFTEDDLSGASASAVNPWIAQLDVETGSLQKFTGTAKNFNSDPKPSTVSTSDLSKFLVTGDKLPKGNNRIDPTRGLDTLGIELANVGVDQVMSSLGGIFDPSAENSFPAALRAAVENGEITI